MSQDQHHLIHVGVLIQKHIPNFDIEDYPTLEDLRLLMNSHFGIAIHQGDSMSTVIAELKNAIRKKAAGNIKRTF